MLSAQLYASVTHDQGATWSTPQIVSGGLTMAFGNAPVVASDGRIYDSFLNTGDLTTGRDTYEVVELDPATGARIAGPFAVGLVFDGNTDSPFAFARETYQERVPQLGLRQYRRGPDQRRAPRGRVLRLARWTAARA